MIHDNNTQLCTNIIEMGKHKDWRKLVKRERRRRIRTQNAKERDKFLSENEYIKEREILLMRELEMIEQANAEENEKWLRAESKAIEQWRVLQEKQKIIQKELKEKEEKMKLEWELDQKKKKEEEECRAAIEEENRLNHEKFMKNLEQFISGDSSPPSELLVSRETKPHAAICPFFSKTGCCRFGDMCSRNHQHPGISKVLLATNFFVHFGMDNATPSEYDTDIMLEYEEIETYKQFKEFFYDVLEEFEKFGKVVMFKVCNNFEKHLRGNVYVEYAELRCAVAAYRALHTRWYGGRQLSLQFTCLKSWKNAICGQQFQKCPKGRACNFLHVFKNPNKMFMRYETGEMRNEDRISTPSTRSWRWSESPEPEVPKRPRSKERHRERYRRRRSEDGQNDDIKEKKHKSRKHEEGRRSKRKK